MSGLNCPECFRYFDDGSGHMEMHAQQEKERDARYVSVVVAQFEHEYMKGYASEGEYERDCRLVGFRQGIFAATKGGPETYQGDGYLMSTEGVEALQEGYATGFAMGSGFRE